MPVQRALQVLSPVVVGMAVSTFRTTPLHLAAFSRGARLLSLVLLGIALFKTGLLLTGLLPDITGLAAEVMTVILLCTFFATRYLVGREKRDLTFWMALACVPVISLTRTAIAATLLTLPLSLGPMRKSHRMTILLLIVAVGLGLFYSPRVQKKMFYTGQGEVSDILGEDFATTGRSFMWEQMFARAQEEHWTGRGSGTGETLVYQITGGAGYPHNDWLLTYFDYGVLGIAVFTGCMLLTVWDCLRKARICRHPETRLLLLAGASAFIPFMLMMMTDNIMVYASFFGNLHFTFLGLAYGSLRAERL
jgi:O-antigen ligase